MDKNFLTESDFKYIRHSNYYTIEKIEYEDFQIYTKRPEEYLSDIVFFNNEMEKSSKVFKDSADDFVSNHYINVKAICKRADSNTRTKINMQVDLNALTLKSLTRFCIEGKTMDVINYISNRNFYFDKANRNLVQISSEYQQNAVLQNTLKSIFSKMAAKQLLENFDKRTKFTCEVDNSLETVCQDMPKATDFKFDSETKQYTFEKTFYEDDKRYKTTYTLSSNENHIIYEVNNYTLNSSYTLIDGFKIDTQSSEINFRTTKVIDNVKYYIDREYENKNLIYTFISDETSKNLE